MLARNSRAVNSVEIGGIRTIVTVPLLKDGRTIGVITIFRTEVRDVHRINRLLSWKASPHRP